MTLLHLGGQVLDDDRSCVACDTPAVAEDYQVTFPTRIEELRAQAQAYARLAEERTAEADILQAGIETATPHAYLCGGCKSRLPAQLRGPWAPTGAWSVGLPMGGRLADAPGSRAESDHIARTLAALEPEPATGLAG